MCAASFGAVALRPTGRSADQGQKVDLEKIIPAQFGEWHMEEQGAAIMVNPQQQELIERIYSQTLRGEVNTLHPSPRVAGIEGGYDKSYYDRKLSRQGYMSLFNPN